MSDLFEPGRPCDFDSCRPAGGLLLAIVLMEDVLYVILVLAMTFFAVGAEAGPARMLMIPGSQDTSGVFQMVILPEVGRRALVWPEGVMVMAEDLSWQMDEERGLLFFLSDTTLVGAGTTGRFRFQPGQYELDTPLLVTDGEVVLFLSAGTVEVRTDRIIYRRPPDPPSRERNRRGEYYVLAGLILATAVLLRAARKRTRRS